MTAKSNSAKPIEMPTKSKKSVVTVSEKLASVHERQKEIIDILTKSETPVSGTALANRCNVSRQIIVQDIYRLREEGFDIIPTSKGYIISKSGEISKVFKLYHSEKDTRKELYLVVDLGGEVRDVFIYHKVYGEIHAKLSIRSRKDADNFCNDIDTGKSNPLMTATGGYHYHTIITRDMETMEQIEKSLAENGFLAALTDYEPDSLSGSAIS